MLQKFNVTRLGYFWKVLATIFYKFVYYFWGYCGKMQILCKTAVDTFLSTFGENWATFYSNKRGHDYKIIRWEKLLQIRVHQLGPKHL